MQNDTGLRRKVIAKVSVLLVAISFLGLASCGSDEDARTPEKTVPAPEKAGAKTDPEEVKTPVEDKNESSANIQNHPPDDASLVFSLRPQQLLNKSGYDGSLSDIVRTMPEIQIPEVIAGLLRNPASLGIDLNQTVHFSVAQVGMQKDLSSAVTNVDGFLCVNATVGNVSLVRGQIALFALLGMQKSVDGPITTCSFSKPALAFAFDENRFALALGLPEGIPTDMAIGQVKQLLEMKPMNPKLEEHLAKTFDLGLYLKPEGVSFVPELLAQVDSLNLLDGHSSTTVLFNPGEAVLSINHLDSEQSGEEDALQPGEEWPDSPESAASVQVALDGNGSKAGVMKVFAEIMKVAFPSATKESPGQKENWNPRHWLSAWTGASLAADGSYLAEISIFGPAIDANETEESREGIRFLAQVDCEKAVSLLRSLPKPEPWRFDLVVAFEELDQLSLSGNNSESELKVTWRDKDANGLASLLNLTRQWQSEREGAELYAAIADGDLDAVNAAMQNVSPNLFDPETGVSPLHFAAWQGQAEMIRYFIGQGLNVNTTDSAGRTALHAACWSGMAETVRSLLEQNATVDSRNANGATPTMGSARMGHAEILDILLESGADLNATDNKGHGLVEYAAAGGRDKIVKSLRDRNATISSPLHVAAGSNDLERIKSLLSEGLEVDQRDGWGGTPLLFAASGGKTEALTYLLKQGADASISDKLGFTLIHAAAVSGNEKILQRVLDMKPDINPRHQQHGSTPLDWAMARQDDVLSEMLRAKGGKTSWELGTPAP